MSVTNKNEILESIGKNLPGVIFYRFVRHFNGDLECDFISDNIIKLSGYSSEEIILKPELLSNLVLPKYLPYIAENVEKSFKEHCNFEIIVECNSIA